MPSEKVHHRKEKRRYTFIVVSSDESKKTHTLTVGKLGFIGAILCTFFVITVLVVASLMYTPVRMWLPIHNTELEQRYGKQIVDIQYRLTTLMQEMIVLREYNLRLRSALGEKVATSDSVINVERDTTSPSMLSDLTDRSDDAPRDNRSEPVEMKQRQSSSTAEINVTTGLSGEHKSAGFGIEFPLTMPVDGFFTRGFDPQQFHFGIDIAGKQGSPILAAADGNVVFAGWTYEYGFTIILAHDRGYMTVYKHNQTIMKNSGAKVKRGELIALLGNTGVTSSGPHLHFEVWKNGTPENPNNYLLNTQ
jgi:murein DD-endopeptidase MepM/ murein hydrolase activator NlpD